MIGRGIFGNPWLFDSKIKSENIMIEEKLRALLEHINLYEKLLGYRNFANMKKHFKSYINGFEGAKELRIKLMGVENLLGAKSIIKSYLKNLN
jgi:tRNA-dihydrouridine synthase